MGLDHPWCRWNWVLFQEPLARPRCKENQSFILWEYRSKNSSSANKNKRKKKYRHHTRTWNSVAASIIQESYNLKHFQFQTTWFSRYLKNYLKRCLQARVRSVCHVLEIDSNIFWHIKTNANWYTKNSFENDDFIDNENSFKNFLYLCLSVSNLWRKEYSRKFILLQICLLFPLGINYEPLCVNFFNVSLM